MFTIWLLSLSLLSWWCGLGSLVMQHLKKNKRSKSMQVPGVCVSHRSFLKSRVPFCFFCAGAVRAKGGADVVRFWIWQMLRGSWRICHNFLPYKFGNRRLYLVALLWSPLSKARSISLYFTHKLDFLYYTSHEEGEARLSQGDTITCGRFSIRERCLCFYKVIMLLFRANSM